jgi:hypothetical protein
VLDYSLLFVIQVFFGGGVSLPRAVLVYSSGGWGNSAKCCAHLFGLSNISQAGLELAVAAVAMMVVAAPKNNILWESFPWSRSSGLKV